MPYPNFHSCRLKEPSDFEPGSLRNITRGGVQLIIGKLKGKNKTTAQAIRYPKETWQVAKARADCESKNGIEFVPASDAAAHDQL
jgi:hypothetical protein